MRHPRTVRRAGFTLLEVLLSSVIAVLLLSALYYSLSGQMRHVQAGRERIEQGTVARALLTRIGNDVSASVSLCDPARFRNANNNSNSSSGMGGSSSSPSSSSTTPSSSASSPSSSNSSSTNSSNSTSNGATNPVVLPLGVMGDGQTLNVYFTRAPSEAWGSPGDGGDAIVTSDLRCVSYWLAGGGLARYEAKQVTTQDIVPGSYLTLPPGGDEAKAIIAPEVRSLQFQYFDGTNWQDSWDSTVLGDDGVTPIGSPRAIAITIGLAHHSSGGQREEVKKYRHVIALVTANGTTEMSSGTVQQSNSGGGATSP